MKSSRRKISYKDIPLNKILSYSREELNLHFELINKLKESNVSEKPLNLNTEFYPIVPSYIKKYFIDVVKAIFDSKDVPSLNNIKEGNYSYNYSILRPEFYNISLVNFHVPDSLDMELHRTFSKEDGEKLPFKSQLKTNVFNYGNSLIEANFQNGIISFNIQIESDTEDSIFHKISRKDYIKKLPVESLSGVEQEKDLQLIDSIKNFFKFENDSINAVNELYQTMLAQDYSFEPTVGRVRDLTQNEEPFIYEKIYNFLGKRINERFKTLDTSAGVERKNIQDKILQKVMENNINLFSKDVSSIEYTKVTKANILDFLANHNIDEV
jgi:hypothetical protein